MTILCRCDAHLDFCLRASGGPAFSYGHPEVKESDFKYLSDKLRTAGDNAGKKLLGKCQENHLRGHVPILRERTRP